MDPTPALPASREGEGLVPPLAGGPQGGRGGPQGGRVAALEAEIDEHVCRLFGLTGEERKMVEG